MNRNVLQAAKANLIMIPLVLIVGVLSSAIITRYLEPQIYAEYATYLSVLSWIIILGEGGFNTGMARFIKYTKSVGSFVTLYGKMQRNRWMLISVISLIAIFYGPKWAAKSDMNIELWGGYVFLNIGLLAAVTLHGQLASAALLATFSHGVVIMTGQIISLLRAVSLGIVAYFTQNLVWLLYTMLVIAFFEALLFHIWVMKDIGFERNTLEKGILVRAQKHGLNILFDKMSTSLSGGAFLLLVLAGYYSRTDLAMLAIAAELIQKALSMGGLPLSNLILPLYNNHRDDQTAMKIQVCRAGELMILLFSVSVGAILVFLPKGIPLFFGQTYTPAVQLAMIWLLPVFLESGVRMIWGTAIFSLDKHSWIMKFNFAYALLNLTIIFCFRGLLEISNLLILVGILRTLMSMLLLMKVNGWGFFSIRHIPVKFVLVIAVATLFGLLVQQYDFYNQGFLTLLLGLLIYICFILGFLRVVPLVPFESYDVICKILGKHKIFFIHLVPRALERSI